MLIFLLVTSVSIIGGQNVSRSNPPGSITIEWTKTEKLSISIPLFGQNDTDMVATFPTTTTTTTSPNGLGDTETSTKSTSTTPGEWNSTTSEDEGSGVVTIDPAIAPKCCEGRDFIIMLDAAAMKNKDKMMRLAEGLIDIIHPTNTENRLAWISYSTHATVLIPLEQKSEKEAMMQTLRNVDYEEGSHLPSAINFTNCEVLAKLPWREPTREVVVIVLAAATDKMFTTRPNEARPKWCEKWCKWCEWHRDRSSTSKAWVECVQRDVLIHRALMTDKYGARLLLITIGEPQFPFFKYVAPAEDTMVLYPFQNYYFDHLNELKLRLSKCARRYETNATDIGQESEKCEDMSSEITYPNCEEIPKKTREFLILIDQKKVSDKKKQIINLIQEFIKLIDPVNTHNEILLGEDNGRYRIVTSKSMDNVSTAMEQLDFVNGADIGLSLVFATSGRQFFPDASKQPWMLPAPYDQERERVIIIIDAGGMTYGNFGNTRPHDDGGIYDVAKHRALMTGEYRAKIFLVNMGGSPLEILKLIAPEKQIVTVNGMEDNPLHPIVELKRRYCL